MSHRMLELHRRESEVTRSADGGSACPILHEFQTRVAMTGILATVA